MSGIVRRSGASYPNLEPLRERIDLVEADLIDQLSLVRAWGSPAAGGLQPRVGLVRAHFVGAPVLTAEFTAVGATSLLEAIRMVDSRDSLLSGVLE